MVLDHAVRQPQREQRVQRLGLPGLEHVPLREVEPQRVRLRGVVQHAAGLGRAAAEELGHAVELGFDAVEAAGEGDLVGRGLVGAGASGVDERGGLKGRRGKDACWGGEVRGEVRGEMGRGRYRVVEDGRRRVVRVRLVGRLQLVEGEDLVDDRLLLRGGGPAGEDFGVVVEAGGRHGGWG